MFSLIRGKGYGLLLKKCGYRCYIDRTAKIIEPYKISFGKRVKLFENVLISAKWNNSKISLGNDMLIHPYVSMFTYGGNIQIENGVGIGPYSILYGHGNLHIKRNTMIAAHRRFIPANHIYNSRQIPIRQ